MWLSISRVCAFFICSFSFFNVASSAELNEIAFLPDIHFHDVYGEFDDGAFSGVAVENSKKVFARSMSAQLRSTRLFNENYFALKQALDEIAKRGTKLVVLPGDFSDDGQPIHVRGLAKILNSYNKRYGIRFFIANGNHDPNRPEDSPGGKSNFLNQDGSELAIYSLDHNKCRSKAVNSKIICSDEVKESGYATLLSQLRNMGFFPDPKDIYWASPFSHYSPENYQYRQAREQANIERRKWPVCNEVRLCVNVTDSSYVVEPVDGIWLLSIDANVYLPKQNSAGEIEFSGSGNQGYNGVVKHKPQLLTWLKQVVTQAKQRDKTLIAFSHFPMTTFYDGQETLIKQLLGESAMQLIRSPKPETVQALVNTGITFHVGGHMHINDTQAIVKSNEQGLINIQAPTLAGYRPAYKLLTLYPDSKGRLRTETLSKVSRFNTLFPLYHIEHKYLTDTKHRNIWQQGILSSKSYAEFADSHLRELARLRFVPKEWSQYISNKNMLITPVIDLLKAKPKLAKLMQQWLADKTVKSDENQWTILDLLHDLYRYRNAGGLANLDISAQRNRSYDLLATLIVELKLEVEPELNFILQVITLLQGFRGGDPDTDLWLDLKSGLILKNMDVQHH